MTAPKFTPDEQYLISSARSPQAIRSFNSYLWGYLIGCAVIAGFSAYYDNVPMMLVAFLGVRGFRIYEETSQKKWTSVWQSILDKYEAALERNAAEPIDRG